MQLRDLQLTMQRHLLSSAETDVGELIVDAPPLPVAQRIAIYKNGYRTRLIDALAETHPMLLQVLGDEEFAQAADGFIDSLPSVHRSIRWYGRELSAHLSRCAPYSAQPILAELAAFEWMLAEVFDAGNAASIDRGALQRVRPEQWSELRIEFHSSLRQQQLEWNTVAVWRALSREQSPPEPLRSPEPQYWLAWRQDFKSNFRSLDPAERVALAAALRGENFATVCAALTPYLDEEDIPLRVATLIAGWIDSGMVTAAAA